MTVLELHQTIKKYSILWWKKRNEAFMYLKFFTQKIKN